MGQAKQKESEVKRGSAFYFPLGVLFVFLVFAFQNCSNTGFQLQGQEGSTFLPSTTGGNSDNNNNGNNIPGDPSTTPTPLPDSTGASPTPSPTLPPSTSSNKYLRGINIMDLGAGNTGGTAGVNYPIPSAAAIKALKGRGLGVLRIPFKWERIQTKLDAPLDAAYLKLVMQVLKDSNAVGIKVILDMHNYASYPYSTGKKFGETNGPTTAQYGDVWKRIVTAVRADASAYNAVYAYDLMNEPHDLTGGAKTWEKYSQAAVDAIRSTGETKLLMIEGHAWSSAASWPKQHPIAWINDPMKNIMYHAHIYMDNDSSGTYVNDYAKEDSYAKAQGHASVGARVVARTKPFADWVATNKTQGFLGEFGWPNSTVCGEADGVKWNEAGEMLMKYLDSVNMGATLWATGTWLGTNGYMMTTYVLPRKEGDALVPLSPSVVLEKHLSQ